MMPIFRVIRTAGGDLAFLPYEKICPSDAITVPKDGQAAQTFNDVQVDHDALQAMVGREHWRLHNRS